MYQFKFSNHCRKYKEMKDILQKIHVFIMTLKLFDFTSTIFPFIQN